MCNTGYGNVVLFVVRQVVTAIYGPSWNKGGSVRDGRYKCSTRFTLLEAFMAPSKGSALY
jgi:hypothetical protein